MFAKSIKIKVGIGWHISSTRFLKSKQEAFFEFENNKIRLLSILNSYGLAITDPGYLLEQNDIHLPEVKKDTYFIESHFKNTIAIVPGSGRPENTWPLENFKLVINHFVSQGYSFIIIGGAQDFEKGETLCFSEKIVNLCGKLGALENAIILKKCIMAICNDTGPMHLAYASGIPVLALFSTRDYRGKWDPPTERKNIVFRAESIISDISPYEVIKALELRLSKR